MTKLSDEQVVEIRKLKGTPGIYATDVAKQYGVSLSLVSRIWNDERRTKTKEDK